MIGPDLTFRREFVRGNTQVARPAIVPELALCLATAATPIWALSEEDLKSLGLPPPYWSYAWAGGQALARYVLDHPQAVAGRQVIDFATGSGVVAIAAVLAGAAGVLASDIDPFCEAAVGLNAEVNAVSFDFTSENLLAAPAPPADLILVGDVWYRDGLAGDVMRWLKAARAAGARVLLGDPGRIHFPKDGVVRLAEYTVPTIGALEGADVMQAVVWELE